MYDPDFFLLDPIPLIENLRSGHKTADEIREFLVLLSVCHTVIPEHTETEVVYHAASPDERGKESTTLNNESITSFCVHMQINNVTNLVFLIYFSFSLWCQQIRLRV